MEDMTEAHAEIFIKKLYEIIGRKKGVEIILIKEKKASEKGKN